VPEVPGAGRVRWIDGFVEPRQCAVILDGLRWTWWWPSVVHRSNGNPAGYASTGRRSETTTAWWFDDRLASAVEGIEDRLHTDLGIDRARLEHWQANRYGPGGRFDPHLDAGLFGAHVAGDRTLTVLLYLDRPEAGGETVFPCLDLAVAPAPGRLVVWANLLADGSIDRTMRHASVPIARGGKTTLITWARQRPFRSGTDRRS
jgi:prolyl 4-hydroxylase